MTSEERKHEPPIIVRGRRAGLGPLRRDLIPTYARWQTDLEVLRGMGHRNDQVLMDAIADDFGDSVLASHIPPDEPAPPDQP